jgi:hypothetical protein
MKLKPAPLVACGGPLLSESERDVVVAGLRFATHVLRQRGGNWQRFHRLAAELERRPRADIEVAVDSHTGYVTTTAVAELLGCTPRHARRLAGRLGGRKHGTVWIVPLDSLPEEEQTCKF